MGWGRETYDAIVLTGSTPVLPEGFVGQLTPGGRLFAVVGDAPVMKARLVRWVAPDALATQDLFETVIDPLKNAATPSRFEF
jgi:protein-L-isoaspartate(D-aspartate) O-methyltransferase